MKWPWRTKAASEAFEEHRRLVEQWAESINWMTGRISTPCPAVPPSTRDLLTAIESLLVQLTQLERKVDQLMPTLDDLQTDLDNIKALVQKQTDLIATLSQNAGGISPELQAKIDALDAEAKNILGTTPTPAT